MKKIENVDQHLVVHDAATVAISGALGGVVAAVTGDPVVGMTATGVLAATGIGGMKVGPVRRAVNRAALAIAEVVPRSGDRA